MRIASYFTLWALVGTIACAQGGITLETATLRDFYPEGVRNEILVQARLTLAPDAATGVAPTRQNVALVLDRSGSMAGERIAALRRAAITTLQALDAHDVVSVVAFGSEVETILPAQPREQAGDIAARIAGIEPEGGSALYDAISQAAAQLRRNARPDTLSRLILLTDGPATKGPRELQDFVKLAAALADEGMLIATIGLGDEIEEDLLAAMARTGHGCFSYADTPAKIAPALRAEFATRPVLAARDVTVTFEFSTRSDDARVQGSLPAAVSGNVVTYAFPRLRLDAPLVLLASAEFSPQIRYSLSEAVKVRVRWTDPGTGAAHESEQKVPARFASDSLSLRNSISADVMRAAVETTFSEGLENAIEALDKHNSRGALRALRAARRDARDLNFELDDAAIEARIARFESYIDSLGGRELGPADRKILRSGVFNQFAPPVAKPEAP